MGRVGYINSDQNEDLVSSGNGIRIFALFGFAQGGDGVIEIRATSGGSAIIEETFTDGVGAIKSYGPEGIVFPSTANIAMSGSAQYWTILCERI